MKKCMEQREGLQEYAMFTNKLFFFFFLVGAGRFHVFFINEVVELEAMALGVN